jgi:hypothetical protein
MRITAASTHLQYAEACTDDAWSAAGFELQADEARCRLLGELRVARMAARWSGPTS